MVKRRLLFISSILIGFFGYSQADSLAVVQDSVSTSEVSILADSIDSQGLIATDSSTIRAPRRFFTPSLYLDYGKLLTNPVSFETKYEGGIELMFLERYVFIGEVGAATLSPEGAYTNGVYESDGIYYRVGLGYLGPQNADNNIGISFRYGTSNFDESGRVFIESASGAQDGVTQIVDRSNLTASWWEVVLYTDRQLFKSSEMFWIGLNLRLRILQNYDSQEEIDVYAIPGYGRSFDKTIPAANLFIKVKF